MRAVKKMTEGTPQFSWGTAETSGVMGIESQEITASTRGRSPKATEVCEDVPEIARCSSLPRSLDGNRSRSSASSQLSSGPRQLRSSRSPRHSIASSHDTCLVESQQKGLNTLSLSFTSSQANSRKESEELVGSPRSTAGVGPPDRTAAERASEARTAAASPPFQPEVFIEPSSRLPQQARISSTRLSVHGHQEKRSRASRSSPLAPRRLSSAPSSSPSLMPHGSSGCCRWGRLCRDALPTKWEVHSFFCFSILAFALVALCLHRVGAALVLSGLFSVGIFLVRWGKNCLALWLLLAFTACVFAMATSQCSKQSVELHRREDFLKFLLLYNDLPVDSSTAEKAAVLLSDTRSSSLQSQRHVETGENTLLEKVKAEFRLEPGLRAFLSFFLSFW
ncbi:hypothetical protein CSUI_008655 [Cystoisospora suis]|uniref:Transmembrane protein n=1 Tax=Cystoisospora suis TaxID=483139 RepID=A0A2C6JM32_9APIC|nr:hypothetical protein CSUI_008655 [Cystoisospora suis]